MAILTVSRQFGSRGDEIAAELARRAGFRLVTRRDIEATMRAHYGFEPPAASEAAGPRPAVTGGNGQPRPNGSGNGDGQPRPSAHVADSGPRAPRASAELALYADLLAAIVADLAVCEHIVLVGRGGQFLLREAACAVHFRVVAPRPWRAAQVAAGLGLAPPAAAAMVARADAAQARYVRTVFGRSAQPSDLYHLVINTAALEFDDAAELAMAAVRSALPSGGAFLSAEAAERLKVRSRLRLARRFADLPGSALLERVPFAHPSERVFARLMDFYGIEWEYEPRTFPIHWNEKNEVVEAFTPDFYLPEMDLWVELTTMKQSLVTRKNRKVKRLREIYPDVNIRVFYQKDVEDLIFKLGASRLAIAG